MVIGGSVPPLFQWRCGKKLQRGLLPAKEKKSMNRFCEKKSGESAAEEEEDENEEQQADNASPPTMQSARTEVAVRELIESSINVDLSTTPPDVDPSEFLRASSDLSDAASEYLNPNCRKTRFMQTQQNLPQTLNSGSVLPDACIESGSFLLLNKIPRTIAHVGMMDSGGAHVFKSGSQGRKTTMMRPYSLFESDPERLRTDLVNHRKRFSENAFLMYAAAFTEGDPGVFHFRPCSLSRVPFSDVVCPIDRSLLQRGKDDEPSRFRLADRAETRIRLFHRLMGTLASLASSCVSFSPASPVPLSLSSHPPLQNGGKVRNPLSTLLESPSSNGVGAPSVASLTPLVDCPRPTVADFSLEPNCTTLPSHAPPPKRTGLRPSVRTESMDSLRSLNSEEGNHRHLISMAADLDVLAKRRRQQ